MPSSEEMLRRVARDPVGQAKFFHLMLELFLVHVLGVGSLAGATEADGIAAGWRGGGLFGAFHLVLRSDRSPKTEMLKKRLIHMVDGTSITVLDEITDSARVLKNLRDLSVFRENRG